MRNTLILAALAVALTGCNQPAQTVEASGNVVAAPPADNSNLLSAGAGAVAGYLMGKASNPAPVYGGGYHAPAPRTVIINKTVVQKNITVHRAPRPASTWRSPSYRSMPSRSRR